MAKTARKAMIIGLDGAFPRIVRRMMAEGKLPTMKRLTRRGTFAEHCLPPFPTITPPNWTSIATGAMPGTHGITDFCVHVPGDPLDKIHNGFDAREVTAEQIWRAADRAGKRCIVLNYPTSAPDRLKYGVRVGGNNLNAGYTTGPQVSNFMGCDDKVAQRTFTPQRFTHAMKIGPARGWMNLPDSALEPRATSVAPFRCVPLKLLICGMRASSCRNPSSRGLARW